MNRSSGLRQKLRPRASHRVLGCNHNKRIRKRPGNPIHRHLLLLHHLQKRRLRLRRCPVDLIRQQKSSHRCSRLILKRTCLFFIHGKSCDIRRKHIRRKLNPVFLQPHRPGESSAIVVLLPPEYLPEEYSPRPAPPSSSLQYTRIPTDHCFFYLRENPQRRILSLLFHKSPFSSPCQSDFIIQQFSPPPEYLKFPFFRPWNMVC